jgi:hypothetical protein
MSALGLDVSDVHLRRASGERIELGALIDRSTVIVAIRYYG